MTRWSWFACDAATGAILSDLPMDDGATFERALSGSGALSGATVTLAGRTSSRRRDLLAATEPGRTAVYAEADGRLVWGGFVWGRPYSSDNGRLGIVAAEWGSYFARRVLRRTLTYAATDQLTIARGLIESAQSESGGNVRCAVDVKTSGVLRDRTYSAGNVHLVGELLKNLSEVIGAFDFSWPVEYDSGGLPRGRLALGYPTLGVTTPALAVEAPRGHRGYTYTDDATNMAVTAWAIGGKPDGSVDTDPVPVSTATDGSLLADGYPLLDRVQTYQSVTDLTTLQAHADADQQAFAGPFLNVGVTVGLGEALSTGLAVGDAVLVALSDDRFPDPFDATLRCIGITYRPTDGTCDLTLAPRILAGGRVPTQETLEQTLARLTRETRLLVATK